MTGRRRTDMPHCDAPDRPRPQITGKKLDQFDDGILAELRQEVADGHMTEDAARVIAARMGLRL